MGSYLVIGIGSTGLAILEQAEQFIFEFTGKNQPGRNVECLYLETDTSRVPIKTASGKSNITQLTLSLGSNAVDIHQLKQNTKIDSSWIPETTDVLKNHNGAGGMPSFGRLSLWGMSNYSKFKTVVQDKYQRLGGNDDTRILIVGSLTGGTGSGLCVDVPYLVRDITKNSNINALLLLPHGKGFGKNKSLHENSHSAMAAIDHYSNHTYACKFPDNITIKDERAPYGLVQYLSQDFTGAKASISDLDELIRVAGVITGLQYMNTDRTGNYFSELMSRRRVDSAGSGRIKNYITSGFLMIQFPKAQLEELFALKVSKELLQNIINPVDYIDQHGNTRKIQGDEVIIKNEVEAKVEDILQQSFASIDALNTPRGVNLSQSASLDAGILDNKSFEQPSSTRYVYDLFSTKTGGNYFEQINNNSSVLRDVIIQLFESHIKQVTNQKKNLTITRFVISSFSTYIDELLSFYRTQYNITGEDSSWDSVIQKHIQEHLSTNKLFQLSGQRKEHSEYMMHELLYMVKIHCLINVLTLIKSHLGSPDNSLRSTSDVILPNQKSVDAKILVINNLINSDGDDSNYTVVRRTNQLERNLDGFSSCFKMIYRLGSRQNDLREAEGVYLKDEKAKIKYSSLFDDQDIWSFLSANSNSLYSEVVKNSVAAISSLNLFSGSSLDVILRDALDSESIDLQKIATMFNDNIQGIRSKLPAMLKLKEDEYTFGEDDCAKLIVLTSDHRRYDGLFDSLNLSPTSDNTCDLSDLSNTLIFYQEYGYMGDVTGDSFNPLKHIGLMGDIKEWVRKKSEDENYLSRKVPYLTNDQYKKYS
tara:strand:+ start:4276 stop:6726 length:2451 start_codon:yes stop_codon:yes gene_type:complete